MNTTKKVKLTKAQVRVMKAIGDADRGWKKAGFEEFPTTEHKASVRALARLGLLTLKTKGGWIVYQIDTNFGRTGGSKRVYSREFYVSLTEAGKKVYSQIEAR